MKSDYLQGLHAFAYTVSMRFPSCTDNSPLASETSFILPLNLPGRYCRAEDLVQEIIAKSVT